MVTFLSGGTGTPKLLDGATAAFTPAETTVVANTGDDVELGGLFVSPDVDTLLFQGGGVLDRGTWWGINGDTHRTHDALLDLAGSMGRSTEPTYLPESRQTAGRDIADWRRFSGVGEFMTIGDRDRAVHLTRTSLLDEGKTLSEATAAIARAFGITIDILPMSDDSVATLVHTDEGLMHFQEFWVANDGEPAIENVEFRGSATAEPAPGVLEALGDVVVVGPSNPITSIGPMLSVSGIGDALAETTVVAVSPFLGGDAFSGPAAKLMGAVGAPPGTAGLPAVYPFADAFVVDDSDSGSFDRPTVETDIRIDSPDDARRVVDAVARAIDLVE
ncbi:2-phospho-L-lactate transferase [Halovivax cerinus]|uniref:2-phospho-L-lactate transferase n=1 Tax=Halovivax cerinus TaxID=1487865 RepID=A0ABD5NP07_9EURY|nr:2-phospho-L-lactate transferase [Halovivax cerinus]